MSQRAVLLVNLGSPDQPDTASVRRYLDQFLMDPYVIQLPWLLRRLIVSLLVLPTRPARSAHAYQSIWSDRGSPLIALSQDLVQAVQAKSPHPVGLAMRYGNPSIESELRRLAALPGVQEILYVPLYPHYAESTVLTSVKEAQRVIAAHRLPVKLAVVPPFYQQPDYIDALAQTVEPVLEQPFDHVLFSNHGIPEQHVTKADPTGSHCLQSPHCCQTPSPAHATCYRHQVLRTVEELVKHLGLRDEQYSISFQSRLGRAKWLGPTTDETLRTLGGKGVKKLLVLCPTFVTDCLETLEEIEIQGTQTFVEAGGESLTLIPCLNSHPAWVDTLVRWVE